MIPSAAKTSHVTSNYSSDAVAFDLEVNSSVFNMLTSDIYSYPHEAVLREWSTNAVDACVAAGKPVVFDVNLPTISNSVFSVRDYGTGLSSEDLTTLFTKLGASTKRNSNQFNGTLGIGRLAALAISDFFTVVSYFNGTEYGYLVSFKDGRPTISSTHTQKTTEPNGLYLAVPVDSSDVSCFEEIAAKVYSFFEHKPNFVGAIDSISYYTPVFETEEWISTSFHVKDAVTFKRSTSVTRNAYVLMSNVVYQVPVSFEFTDKSRIPTHYNGSLVPSVIFKAEPGEVSFNPGREVLVLDQKTTEFLYRKIQDFHKNLLADCVSALLDLPTDMDRLRFINDLSRSVASHLIKPFSSVVATFDSLHSLAVHPRYSSEVLNFYGPRDDISPFAISSTPNAWSRIIYQSIPASDFLKAKHYLVDYPSNYSTFQAKLRSESSSGCVFWHPQKGTDFQKNLRKTKEYLLAANIPFQLFSTLFPQATPETSKKSSPKTITLFSITSNLWKPVLSDKYYSLEALQEALPSSEDYAILPMVRSSFDVADQKKHEAIIEAFRYFYPTLPVYGLRRSEMAHFGFDFSKHDLYAKVQQALETTPIRVFQEEYYDLLRLRSSLKHSLEPLEDLSKLPSFLLEAQNIVENLYDYCALSSTLKPSTLEHLQGYTIDSFSSEALDRLSEIFFDYPSTFHIIRTYPHFDIAALLRVSFLEKFHRDRTNDD